MGNPRKQKQTKARQKFPMWILPALIGLLVIAGLLGATGKLNLPQGNSLSSSASEEEGQTDDPGKAAMRVLIKSTRHLKGSPDAPVTILEFSDFQ